MKSRLVMGLVLVLVVCLAVVVLVPAVRFAVLGYFRHEPFYEGEPTSYWVHALKANDNTVRQHAAFVLGRIGERSPEAAAGLIEALQDKDEFVRSNAATSAALPALKRPLKRLGLILSARSYSASACCGCWNSSNMSVSISRAGMSTSA